MSIFEQASRKKLRIVTPLGNISVEDLWDLPLTLEGRTRNLNAVNLNGIAVALHRELQDSTVSFVDAETKASADLQLRFDVVKHIIDVKKAERVAALEASARAERKQKLLGILARKQDAELEGMSLEDLKKLIDET